MDDILDDSFLNPELSRKRDRVFAAIIDLGLSFVLTIVMITMFGEPYEKDNGERGHILTGPLSLIPFLFWFIIVPISEGIWGQSLGKMILKIKVINVEFSKASIGQTIVRHLFDIVDWIPGFGIVGLLVASNNRNSQRVGDLVAKTIVVKK